MENMSKKDKELYARISEVLHYIWDPIGVADIPNARNEYNSYLPHLFRLVIKNNDVGEVAKYLNMVQSKKIGLGSNLKKCKEVAIIIVNWHKFITS